MPQTAVSYDTPGLRTGTPVDYTDTHSVSRVSEETALSLAYGVMVKRGTDPKQMKALTAITDKVDGIVMRSQARDLDTEIDTVGVKPGQVGEVMRRGRIMVPVEGIVTPASGVHVRAIANGGNTLIGAFRATADGVNTIDISAFARWESVTTGAGVAALSILLP